MIVAFTIGAGLHADSHWLLPALLLALNGGLAVCLTLLLAYHVAVVRGCPIDKPRNLAKSVTVE